MPIDIAKAKYETMKRDIINSFVNDKKTCDKPEHAGHCPLFLSCATTAILFNNDKEL